MWGLLQTAMYDLQALQRRPRSARMHERLLEAGLAMASRAANFMSVRHPS